MAENIRAEVETINKKKLLLNVAVTIGASGAVSSQSPAAAICGLTVTEIGTETGRYLVTPYKTAWSRLSPVGAVLEGPADTAMGNTAGNATCVRNVSASSFDVQTFLASSGADTDTTSGNKLHITALVEE